MLQLAFGRAEQHIHFAHLGEWLIRFMSTEVPDGICEVSGCLPLTGGFSWHLWISRMIICIFLSSRQGFLQCALDVLHFQFVALPFGLSTIPNWVFIKVLAPILGPLCILGVPRAAVKPPIPLGCSDTDFTSLPSENEKKKVPLPGPLFWSDGAQGNLI